MEVAYLALEIRFWDPDGSTDIVQEVVRVALQSVDGGDTINDSDLSEIAGAAVVSGNVRDGSGGRRTVKVVEPDGVVISAGTWIRPVTTSPVSGDDDNTSNRAVFTVWLRQAGD